MSAMVVIHRAHGYRFVIYLFDHESAHVHITGPGQAKVNLPGPKSVPEASASSDLRCGGCGFNLHWRALDVDLYVPALVAGIFGTRAWMTRELARVAGQTKSPAKAAASRSNGAKGGRPRKLASA